MIQLDSSEHKSHTPTAAKIVPVTSRISPWLSGVAYPLGRYVVLPFYFGHIEVTGREHLPTEGPIILAPTHRSRWDAFMVPYAAGHDITGRHLRFMVSANEVTGLQGFFIRRFGGFPVDTEHPAISSLRHGVELLRSGEILVIFPDGNIYRDSGIQPLKPGLARMALQAEVGAGSVDSSHNHTDISAKTPSTKLGTKIVPMTIKYSQPVPQWGCDVQIRIGSPLQVADYCTTSVKKSAQRLTSDLETALKNLY